VKKAWSSPGRSGALTVFPSVLRAARRSLGGQAEELRDSLEVPVSVSDVNVAEVGGQLGELALHVAPLAVPANEHLHGEPVPHVMEPRPVAAATARWRAEANDPGDDREGVFGDRVRDAGAALGDQKGW
jgi:hypothetical protein